MKNPSRCKVCGNLHGGQFCPDVKSIKFYSNGNIEHIEYYPTQDKIIEAQVKMRVEAEVRRLQEEMVANEKLEQKKPTA